MYLWYLHMRSRYLCYLHMRNRYLWYLHMRSEYLWYLPMRSRYLCYLHTRSFLRKIFRRYLSVEDIYCIYICAEDTALERLTKISLEWAKII